MVDKEKLTGETPLHIFLDYLEQNFQDAYPLNEELSEFKRGRYAGIIEIERFLVSVCRPKQEE